MWVNDHNVNIITLINIKLGKIIKKNIRYIEKKYETNIHNMAKPRQYNHLSEVSEGNSREYQMR